MENALLNMMVKTCAVTGLVLLVIGSALFLGHQAEMMEESAAASLALGIGVALSILSLAALLFNNSRVTRRLEDAHSIAAKLARGQLYTDEPDDELKDQLRSVSKYIEHNARLVNKIAEGDLNSGNTLFSDNDVLGKAYKNVVVKLGDSLQTQEIRDRLELSVMKLLNEVSDVSKGDLTVSAEVSGDVTGEIAVAFNLMTRNLRSLIKQVKDVTQRVGTSAEAINDTTEQLARGSSAQSSQIARTKASIANMSEQILAVSENATVSSRVAGDSLKTAQVGVQAARENISAMNAIRKQVQETAKRIKRLGERSQEISQIVSLIEDLSDRTSVLALNASLQASAGGRGSEFTSVAKEVERLAERSTKLTKQIATLTHTISVETQEAVTSMEETIREVTLGSASAEKAGRSLVEIERVTSELAGLIRTISDSTRSHAKVSEDLSGAMSDISQVTELIQLSSKRAADAVKSLVQLSGDLRNSVSPFKLPAEMPPITREPEAGIPANFIN
ncbi:MAG: methyl-accepting chemotaxis protein [Acidobacteria bacterium]|nr:methyl-accepting chemotaxis protein [Acidobacteriota bacterium]